MSAAGVNEGTGMFAELAQGLCGGSWLLPVVFWVSVALMTLVFVCVLYSLWLFRRSRKVGTELFHKNAAVELIWTLIPFALLALLVIPAAAKFKTVNEVGGCEHEAVTKLQKHECYGCPDTVSAVDSLSRIVSGVDS